VIVEGRELSPRIIEYDTVRSFCVLPTYVPAGEGGGRGVGEAS